MIKCDDLFKIADGWKTVSAEKLDALEREASRIMTGREVQDPLWQFGYEINRLAFDSRHERFIKPFFDRVCDMFCAVNRRDRDLVWRSFNRVVFHDGNYWIGDHGEYSVEKRIRKACRMFNSDAWRIVTHPKTVSRLDAMIEMYNR